jgi:hypothetical protein
VFCWATAKELTLIFNFWKIFIGTGFNDKTVAVGVGNCHA